jgi:hypothetical protein
MHRPRPAMAVALAALVISMGGTAVAASHLVSGDKLIKRGTLSGNRLRAHTLTGAQINSSTLGQVPSARNATHATTADSAVTANALPALNWVPLTLTNGWLDTNGVNDARTPAMAIDAQGIVHLRGAIRNDTTTNDQFAVAPSQFRPSQTVSVATTLKFGNAGVVRIFPSGTMSVNDPSAGGLELAYTSLDGLTYALG